jgi:hypothetical protein
MRLTIGQLRQMVSEGLAVQEASSVNFWNHEYHYDPRTDTVNELVKGAQKWYSFAKVHLDVSSPADPKFLKKLIDRMRFLGIDDDTIEKVVLRLRVHKASSAMHSPVK